MTYQQQEWSCLVQALDEWTAARETDAGYIEVAVPCEGLPDRQVLIVMTPEEWSDLTGTMWGSFEDALLVVKYVLTNNLGPDDRFAVYGQYSLEPSTQPTLSRTRDAETRSE